MEPSAVIFLFFGCNLILAALCIMPTHWQTPFRTNLFGILLFGTCSIWFTFSQEQGPDGLIAIFSGLMLLHLIQALRALQTFARIKA